MAPPAGSRRPYDTATAHRRPRRSSPGLLALVVGRGRVRFLAMSHPPAKAGLATSAAWNSWHSMTTRRAVPPAIKVAVVIIVVGMGTLRHDARARRPCRLRAVLAIRRPP